MAPDTARMEHAAGRRRAHHAHRTFENPETPVSAAIETIIYSFHMPLFMFISGFLFYYTKISRNIAYKNVVIDKLKRLGIPFLFFTLFTFAVKFAFAPFMKRPVELSISQFVNSFLYPGSNPLSENVVCRNSLYYHAYLPSLEIYDYKSLQDWNTLIGVYRTESIFSCRY